jgi:hypothetical protein
MPALPFAAFSFGDGLLTVVELAFFFLWIWIAVGVVFDVFRSQDLTNVSKALWVLFIFIFPLVGVLGYLIIRGHTMHEHQVQDASRLASFSPRAGGGTTGELGMLAHLRERGVLTEEEFERAKAKILG